MKPRPRIRKTVKWGGAAVSVLLVVAWVGTGWCRVFWQYLPGQGEIVLQLGGVEVYYFYTTASGAGPETQVEGPYQQFHPPSWGFSWVRAPNMTKVVVPLWSPCLASLLAAAVAWRLDTLARRRARLNHCPKCTYDRTGLAAGAVCPECGKLPA